MGTPSKIDRKLAGAVPPEPRSVDLASSLGAELASTRADLNKAQRELETLHAALDNVHSGLLLLDGKLRAQYSNPALHRIFKSFSAEEIRTTKPFYADLLRAGAAAAALDDYVARRLAWVASGDPQPMDLPMADGTVLRCQLAILPGGGRMLIYSDVTDIVRNAQAMEQLATIDGMTGIFNRRHFLALADREWERARRYQRPLSFLMVDIDFFKTINDRFGHEAGDRAIIQVANLARDCKRTSDLLARIGGEEFGLLLTETNLAQAQAMAERLRRAVAGTPLAGVAHAATVSIGVATADQNVMGVSDLMRMADQALYDAKRTGRNKVICSLAPTTAPAASATFEPQTEAGSRKETASRQ